MITIDKNIPLPRHYMKYPFKEMDVGDSFLTKANRNAVTGASAYWGRKLNTRYINREVAENGVEGVRVWRIK
jgi:hypothetical protein